MAPGNGKSDFIEKQIGDAIVKVEKSDGALLVPEIAELSILSVRVGEVALEEIKDLKVEVNKSLSEIKEIVQVLVDQRKFTSGLWRLAAALVSTSGLLGTVFMLLRIVDLYGGTP